MNGQPGGDFTSGVMIGFVAGALMMLACLVVGWFIFRLFSPWLRAFMSGKPVSLFAILGMRLRGTPASLLIDAYIALAHGGSQVKFSDVERTYLARRSEIHTSEDLVRIVAASSPATSKPGY